MQASQPEELYPRACRGVTSGMAPFLTSVASGELPPVIQGSAAAAAAGLKEMKMGMGPGGMVEMDGDKPKKKKSKKKAKGGAKMEL